MSRYIDRAELFNRLSSVHELSEAFSVIQEMPDAIPVPHGRLIDADELVQHGFGDEKFKSVVRRIVMQAPTVIEAEEDEDG